MCAEGLEPGKSFLCFLFSHLRLLRQHVVGPPRGVRGFAELWLVNHHQSADQLGRSPRRFIARPRLMEPQAEPHRSLDCGEELVEVLALIRISAVRMLETLQLLPCHDNDRGKHFVQERRARGRRFHRRTRSRRWSLAWMVAVHRSPSRR